MATRNERVVLELEDRFTTGMAKAAASAALLNKELDSLSKESVRTRRSVSDIDSGTSTFARNAGTAGREIDKLSGRVRILADAAAILGPALIPIGAVGVPAITGLASQLGFAVTAAGTAVLAFQGVGGALKTLNAAALDPSTKNLEAATVALENLTPAARSFVAEIGTMLPELTKLRDLAAEGLFPGLTTGLDALQTALPKVQQVIASVSLELGDISKNVGESLASDRWTPFLDFVAAEAPNALSQMAEAAGNTGHAIAELFVATNPLNNDFLGFLVNSTAALDEWAQGLSQTQGFADFLDYVETTGPKVAEAFGAIANAAVQILQAAAPLGGPVLDGIKALADVVAAFANSDLGTPLFTAVAALALFNRTLAITASLQSATFGRPAIAAVSSLGTRIQGLTADLSLLRRQSELVTLPGKNFIGPLTEAQSALTRVRTTAAGLGKSAALVAGLGVATTGAADKINLTNTASLALAGTFIAPGWGTAIGAAIGGTIDLSHASDGLEDSLKRVKAAAKAGDFTELTAGLDDVKKRIDDLGHQDGIGDAISDGLTRASQAIKHPGDFLGLGSTTKRAADANNAAIAAEQARTIAASQRLLRDGFIATATGADRAAQSTSDFQRSLEKLNQVLSGRASLRDYEQALDDFTQRATDRAKVLDRIRQERTDFAASQANTARDLAAAQRDVAGADTPGARQDALKRIADIQAQAAAQKRAHEQRMADLQAEAEQLRNTLNVDLQAGRDTTAALDAIATTALQHVQTEKLTGAQRTEFLAAARAEYVKFAVQAGASQKVAEDLATAVLGLNGVVGKPKIVIDADGAWHVIDETQDRINALHGKTIEIQIIRRQGDAKRHDIDMQQPQVFPADGITVPGQRLPYGDKVPALLSPGEEVISNRHGQADRNRDLLKAINANRLENGGTIARATGGQVVPFGPPASMATSVDYQRIADLVLAARPLYGDVTVHGDNSFRREMQSDASRASRDGIHRG